MASKRQLGLWIVILLVLGVSTLTATLVIHLGTENTHYVTYFTGPVNRLRRGANVLFQGVRIGYVESVQLQIDVDSGDTMVEALMHVDPAKYRLTRDGQVLDQKNQVLELGDASPRELVEVGLRASLRVESHLTGQQLVEVDFFPESKAVFRGAEGNYHEVPSIEPKPNLFQFIQLTLAKTSEIEFEQLNHDLLSALSYLESSSESERLMRSLASLSWHLNQGALIDWPKQLEAAFDEARETLSDIDARAQTAHENLSDYEAALSTLVRQLSLVAPFLSAQAKYDKQLEHDIARAIEQLEAAESLARHLRGHLDLIDVNPEKVLRNPGFRRNL